MGLTEKQRNCPYCHVGSNRPTYPLFDGYSINNVTGKKTEITVIKDSESIGYGVKVGKRR